MSDDFAFHGKVVAAGAAMATWVRAGAWAAQQLSDGFVPAHIVPLLGPKKDAGKLVAVGLWEAVEGGFRFHDWGEYQPTRAEIEDKRAKRQEAGRKGGVRSGQSRRSSSSEANAEANASRSVPTTTNTRPDPSRPKPNSAPTVRADKPPARTPSPFPSAAEPAARNATDDAPDDGTVHAGTVIAAWYDACKANGVTPSAAQRGQVGKQAKELLRTNDPIRVLEAASQAGAKGFASIDRELTAMNGRHIPNARQSRGSTEDVVAAVQSLKRRRPVQAPDQLAIGG